MTERPPSVALAAVLTLGMGVCTFLTYGFGALGPYITDDVGLSRTALGSLTTTLYAVGAVLSPSAGTLVDRVGGRRSMLALFALGGTGTFVVAAADGYALLVAGSAVTGLSLALGNTSTNQLLATTVDPGRRGLLTGIKQSGVQMAAFVAGLGLPALAEETTWRWALAASGLIALAGFAMTMVVVPAGRVTAARRAGRAGRRPIASEPAAPALDPMVGPLARYAFAMGLGVGATGAYLPLYAVEELGFGRTAAGGAAAVMGLVGIIARVLWGRGQDRAGVPVARPLTALAGGAVASALMLWLADGVGPGLLWAGAGLAGATAVAWNALGMLAIVRDGDPRVAGRASGRVVLGFYAGFVVGPVSFGWLADRTEAYDAGWALVVAAFAAAAVVARRWDAAGSAPPAGRPWPVNGAEGRGTPPRGAPAPPAPPPRS